MDWRYFSSVVVFLFLSLLFVVAKVWTKLNWTRSKSKSKSICLYIRLDYRIHSKQTHPFNLSFLFLFVVRLLLLFVVVVFLCFSWQIITLDSIIFSISLSLFSLLIIYSSKFLRSFLPKSIAYQIIHYIHSTRLDHHIIYPSFNDYNNIDLSIDRYLEE